MSYLLKLPLSGTCIDHWTPGELSELSPEPDPNAWDDGYTEQPCQELRLSLEILVGGRQRRWQGRNPRQFAGWIGGVSLCLQQWSVSVSFVIFLDQEAKSSEHKLNVFCMSQGLITRRLPFYWMGGESNWSCGESTAVFLPWMLGQL